MSRCTALFCCILAETCKMKPLMVPQAARPQAFHHVKDMDSTGDYWLKAPKAWKTSQIVIDWFDTCFIPNVHCHCRRLDLPFKVLLLLDNGPSHSQLFIGRHKCVKREFLPPNTTSLLHPMDREVICNIRMFYQCCGDQQLLQATGTEVEVKHLEEEKEEEMGGISEESEGDNVAVTATSTPPPFPYHHVCHHHCHPCPT